MIILFKRTTRQVFYSVAVQVNRVVVYRTLMQGRHTYLLVVRPLRILLVNHLLIRLETVCIVLVTLIVLMNDLQLLRVHNTRQARRSRSIYAFCLVFSSSFRALVILVVYRSYFLIKRVA